MRATLPPLIAILLALALIPASAHHCTTYSTSTNQFPEGTFVHDTGPYYVVVDPCILDCYGSIYTYSESNGIPGLQRGDITHDDTCHGMIRSDTLDPY